MSIANYDELKTAVSNWLNRGDLTSYIPDFITFGEADINRRLRILPMEKRVQSDTASGDVYVALPSDFAEAVRITLIGSPNSELDYKDPTALNRLYKSNTTGPPTIYTIEGTELRLAPATDSIYTLEIRYFAKFAALSDSNTTNWLTANAPDLLLYSALYSAEPFLKNDSRVLIWRGLSDKIFSDLETEDRNARYSGSPLTMQVM